MGRPTAWWLQIVVFGLLTALFVVRAVAARGFASWGYHALAVGAMTWMVVAMPLLGHSIGTGGLGHGHGGAAGVATPPVTPVGDTPQWAVGVTVALAGVLVVSALVRAVAGARKSAPLPAGSGKRAALSVAGLSVAGLSVAGLSVAGLPAAGGRHALMSVGMAGMLLVLV